jgi:hypothetical protein
MGFFLFLTITLVSFVDATPAKASDAAVLIIATPVAEQHPPHVQQATELFVVEDKIAGNWVEPRPGDLCLICDKPIGRADIIYMVNGQRVAVHRDVCLVEFRAHPERFLATLRPRGAFLGAGAEGQNLSYSWFLVGLYVLIGLVFSAVCAQRALHAGRNPMAWFGVGLMFNAFGYLLLLMRPKRKTFAPAGVPEGLQKVPATYAPQPCPGCGHTNHPSATECAGCGGKLQPAIQSEVKKVGLRPS